MRVSKTKTFLPYFKADFHNLLDLPNNEITNKPEHVSTIQNQAMPYMNTNTSITTTPSTTSTTTFSTTTTETTETVSQIIPCTKWSLLWNDVCDPENNFWDCQYDKGACIPG